MLRFRDLSIQRKLMVIAMITTLVALFLSSAGFFVYDFVSFREKIVDDLGTLAETLSLNVTQTVVYNNPTGARETLESLRVQPRIVSASIYARDGTLFARYLRDGVKTDPLATSPRVEGYEFKDQILVLSQPVRFRDQAVGTLHLASDLEEIRARRRNYAGILGLVLVGTTLVAFVVSARLQRVVSRPVLELAELEKQVSARKDFSLRATKHSNDEIGLLIDGFNEMLSEIQARDEELVVARDKAEGASRSKSAFLANMSHELRTPLNAIIGYSEILQEDAEDLGQEGFLPDLEKIRAAGKHLLALINGILDLSKVEAGKMEFFLEDFDLPKLVQEVASTVTPLVEKKNNHFEVECSEELGAMHADLTKTRQILFNILSNASKFTENGTIGLSVVRRYDRGQEWVLFRITDTGIGMNDEQLERLFKPFSQAEASISREYGGTGLGLSISQHFCKMMGGRIFVESEPGRGSTFLVRLPARVVDPKETAKSVHELLESGAWSEGAAQTQKVEPDGELVLVIDDDLAVHELLEDLLHREGFRVAKAMGAQEGLRMARELNPALITLDVMLPDEDGWSVLQTLKADPDLADTPVVMISVVDEPRRGYALGASEYVTKPIERDKLVALLTRFRQRGVDPVEVLVIDDDAEDRSRLRRILEKEGWSVSEADNGVTGLRQVAASPPGVILLDLMMPTLDGFGFLRELRKTPAWRAIPVIVVTAMDLDAEERRRLNGGVEKILQKGAFSLDDFRAEVRSLVRASLGA